MGENNDCGDCAPGLGILASVDGGTTWAAQNPGGVFTGAHVSEVAIDPSNSNHQFAATDRGLFVTTDGGGSWAKPSDASYATVDGNVTAVVIDPASPSTVYLGGGAQFVAKSTDGGVTWSAARSGIASVTTGDPNTALAIAKSDTATLYVAIGSGAGAVAVYKTTNHAGSWSALAGAPDYTGQAYSYGSGTSEQGNYDNVIAVDPANANHVVAGGISLVETTNGGTSWSNVNGHDFATGVNLFHPDQHALAFAGGKVFIGQDGGIYRYDPAGPSVANLNGNLGITQFYHGFGEVSGTVLAGSQDNSSARTSSPTVGPWTGIWAGDGGSDWIVANNPSMQFIDGNQHLLVTTDGFATITDITPPPLVDASGNVDASFTPPELAVPNTGTPSAPTEFYGGHDLWRTTNPGAATPTWTKVTSTNSYVSAIAVAPSNTSVVYVGFTDGTIEVSTDGGVTFAALLSPQPFSDTFVTGISVDPANSNAITASVSFTDTRGSIGLPHVAQYVRSGTVGTWTVITGNLSTQAAVSRVVYDNGSLVAATDDGVFAAAAPAGASTVWTPVGTGLPNVQVQDLFVDPGGDIFAVTHGRGAWKLHNPISTVPGAPTGVVAVAAPESAVVSWTPPASDGGWPITGYRLTPFIGGVAQPALAKTFNNPAATETLGGLTDGTTYTIRVAAINAIGPGPDSADSNPVKPVTVPGPPTGAHAKGGPESAVVSWTAPGFDGGTAITGYRITPYIGGVAQPASAVIYNNPGTTETIGGLIDGSSYTFSVAAINIVGTGADSTESNAVVPATTPSAPTAVFAVAGSGSATVSWTRPSSDGASPIIGYRVTPFVGGIPQTTQSFASTATTEALYFLTNGVTYTFRVAAVNGVGQGPDSTDSNAVTPRIPIVTLPATGSADAFVIAAYTDFLNRPPTAVELATRSAAISAGTLTRKGLVTELADSSEWVSVIVNKFYADTLGRPGEASGVAFWTAKIRNHQLTVARVAAGFYASPEYFRGIGGGTNTSWITDLYSKILHRQPDAAGIASWTAQIAAHGRTSVAYQLYQSNESRHTRVAALYQALLGRATDTPGADYWAAVIERAGDIALASDLAASHEYYQRAQARFP